MFVSSIGCAAAAVQHRTPVMAASRVLAAILAVFAALAPDSAVGAHAFTAAVAAKALDAVMIADAGAPAVLAGLSHVVMLADASAPAVLAGAPLAVMLADAGAPAVLVLAPDAVMLADAGAPAVLEHARADDEETWGLAGLPRRFGTELVLDPYQVTKLATIFRNQSFSNNLVWNW
jgi:hypothetical protein